MLEEIALYLIFSETESLSDLYPKVFAHGDDWLEWLGELLGDLDVEHLLFRSGQRLTPRIGYHFDHWLEDQFWVEHGTMPSEEESAELLDPLVPEGYKDGEN